VGRGAPSGEARPEQHQIECEVHERYREHGQRDYATAPTNPIGQPAAQRLRREHHEEGNDLRADRLLAEAATRFPEVVQPGMGTKTNKGGVNRHPQGTTIGQIR